MNRTMIMNKDAEQICGAHPADFSAAAGLGLPCVEGSLTVYDYENQKSKKPGMIHKQIIYGLMTAALLLLAAGFCIAPAVAGENEVYGSGTFNIVSSSEDVIRGGCVTITVFAPEDNTYPVGVTNGMIPEEQENITVDAGVTKVIIGPSGFASFEVKSTSKQNLIVKVSDGGVVKKAKEITVRSGVITISAETDSICIGENVRLNGTNEFGGELVFFVKGTNFPITEYKADRAYGKVWNMTLQTSQITDQSGRGVDAGTYTVYGASLVDGYGPQDIHTPDDLDNTTMVQAYNTIGIAFMQPYIILTSVPEVIVQGEKVSIKGVARGNPVFVAAYIFGPNYFRYMPECVVNDEHNFTINLLSEETRSDTMAAGQYFLVVQHPMYDNHFNIGVVTSAAPSWMSSYFNDGDVIKNKQGEWSDQEIALSAQSLFNVHNRQAANAAQALCDALDSQDIDDMYQKASFIVAGPTSYVDAVPSQITKGQILTVSGTTTGHKGEIVSVELLSTAFAVVPKDSIGPESFVTLTTRIGDDGKWSISFDTSGLNADTYTCSIAVGLLDAVSCKVTIVDGGAYSDVLVDIPTYVVKGTPLLVSGIARGHAGEAVTGNIAGPGYVNIPLPATTVGTDGTWSISLATTGLNVSPYVCTIHVGSSYTTTKGFSVVSQAVSGFENLIINPSGSLVPGDTVTAIGEIRLPAGAADAASKISLKTGLVGASWTVDIIKGDLVANTKHPADPYCYITGFDLDFDVDITLRFTVTGIVSPESAGRSISVMQAYKAGMHDSGPQTYATPEQYVYNVGYLNSELTLLNNALSTLDSRITYYQGQGYDVSQVQNRSIQAHLLYNAAVSAGSATPRVAFENIYAATPILRQAQMELARISLNMSMTYTTAVTADVSELHVRGMDAEATLVETKNTGLKNTYAQLLAIYNAGSLPDATALDKLAADALALHEEALGYIEEGQVTSMKLGAGWNFVSVPKKLSAAYDTAAELFAGVNTGGKAILSYNAESKVWEQVKADTVITPLSAYWIYSTEVKTITPEFDATVHTPAIKKLYEGWNAVGISAEKAMTAAAVFNNINWRTFLSWNAADQKYRTVIIKGGSGEYSDSNYIPLWRGGWVYMDADGTYIGYA